MDSGWGEERIKNMMINRPGGVFQDKDFGVPIPFIHKKTFELHPNTSIFSNCSKHNQRKEYRAWFEYDKNKIIMNMMIIRW